MSKKRKLAKAASNAKPHDNAATGRNVGQRERAVSALGGGALVAYGLLRRDIGGVALALIGGGLVYRGATGHCQVYEQLGVSHAAKNGGASVNHNAGIKVERAVTINKSPAELYSFWRKLENLPRFMRHLESVRSTGDGRSHWVAKAPAGMTVEWDAEIISEKENELLAWRSLENSDVPNAGSVRFIELPKGRGTEVKVALNYEPPFGKPGALLAKLFGEEPGLQVADDLRRFKQLMEAGETATIEGQSSGRAASAAEKKLRARAVTA